jgi:glycosyltransferase involved in cell wall biosynthesis
MICAKTLVAPSRWEGMPYLLLEAVARGRCVIASDCPGNRDVLKNYPHATLFPLRIFQFWRN